MFALFAAAVVGLLSKHLMGPGFVPTVGSGQANLFAVSTPSFPATTVWQQNTTGVDVVVALGLSGVTQTHIYVSPTNGTTGAIDFTTQAPSVVIIPNGYYFSMTYSAGSPSWKWQGLI